MRVHDPLEPSCDEVESKVPTGEVVPVQGPPMLKQDVSAAAKYIVPVGTGSDTEPAVTVAVHVVQDENARVSVGVPAVLSIQESATL